MLNRRPHPRHWFVVCALAVAAVSLLPPVSDYARRYIFVEAIQFAMFALVVPALVVLGAPWRLARLSRGDSADPSYRVPADGGPADRLALSRHRNPSFIRAAAFLAVFAGAAIAWRLPATVDALARRPVLAVLEMATLLVAGAGLWLELVESPPLAPRLSRPQRATLAALAMWTTWILAYLLGFSHVAWFRAYPHSGWLSPVADQEIATITLWAVAAACFVPVVYATMMVWLKDSADPDDELRRVVDGPPRSAGVRGWERTARRRNAPSG
jgi:cytochrome c oxidase assembly factor CtaG